MSKFVAFFNVFVFMLTAITSGITKRRASFAISIPLGSVCVCVCMRVCLYVSESSQPFIIYYRLCMLAPDSS